jgi:SNF2 family DNA or RNA helicase
MNQYPANKPPSELKTEEEKQRWFEIHVEKTKGPLYRFEWARVVFDECQNIRNPATRRSQAATAISARFRWLLSGTPLINTPEEFYSYFRILDMPTGDIEEFKHKYCRNEEARLRLQGTLHSFMMRRTHATKIMNKPIITLPKNTQHTVEVEFNALERAIYDLIELRFVERLLQQANKEIKDSKYSHIFTLLLRLRQITSHIFLVQEAIFGLLTLEDVEKIAKIIKDEIDKPGEPTSKTTLRSLHANMLEKLKHPESFPGYFASSPSQHDPNGNSDIVQAGVGSSFGNYCVTFKRQLEEVASNLEQHGSYDERLCACCGEKPRNPQITDCRHVYCIECLESLPYIGDASQFVEVDEAPIGISVCRQCGHTIQKSRDLDGGIAGLDERTRKTPLSAETDSARWFLNGGHLYPSTKLLAVKAQLAAWLENSPSDKIIVFSQFVSVLKYAASMARDEGLGVVMVSLAMSQVYRY